MADFTFTEKAMEQYIYWQTQDRKTLKKINSQTALYTALMKDKISESYHAKGIMKIKDV